MAKEKEMHAGHRERMTEKLIENGHWIFNDHEILEILLFFSIPRKNVNETAHLLLGQFGTLQGVLDADISDLCSVEGIGMKSALLIKVVAAISARASAPVQDKRQALSSFDSVSKYLASLFQGEGREKLYMISLSPAYKVISKKLIFTGTVAYSEANVEKIAREAVKSNARYVIIAHNHPHGVAIPSDTDIESTMRLSEVLKHIDVELIDHFVVAGRRVTPIIHYPESLRFTEKK
ncbi:MAG: DNA repair protein RadC [Ruminococcaceae bacterium]|nr:DNA repair protein RadC [Oscillospiraceae bacterium]